MALCNKLFLSSLTAGGQLPPALSAWRAQLWVKLSRRAAGRTLHVLRRAANLGLGLPFDLFFFLPQCSHYAMCGVSWCLGERLLDPEGRLGLPVCSRLFYTKIWAPFCIMPSVSPKGLCVLPQSSQSRQGQTREQSSSSVADMMING